MDARVRRLRKQARMENGGRSGRRLRYSRGLRALAVDYLRQQVKGGGSAEKVASELGVSGWSLIRWSRRTDVERRSELREVEVVCEVPTSLVVTLVTPDGYRMEGVKVREVRSVLSGRPEE